MLITRTSMATGIKRERDLPITQAQIDAWAGGQLIQQAMPQLGDADREFFLTGMTDDEWAAMCPDDEE